MSGMGISPGIIGFFHGDIATVERSTILKKVNHLFLWAIAIAILDKIVYVQKP